MASFDPDIDLSEDLAFRMLSSSPVTLFYRPEVLRETQEWLDANGYQIVSLHTADWDLDTLHDDFVRALHFPDYYGRNFNALNDCLRDVVEGSYGWDRPAAGLVITLNGYDRFAAAHASAAHGVLDILARQSRDASLIGRRLLCLVQSDDPDLSFEQVGSSPVWWNSREWLTSARR